MISLLKIAIDGSENQSNVWFQDPICIVDFWIRRRLVLTSPMRKPERDGLLGGHVSSRFIESLYTIRSLTRLTAATDKLGSIRTLWPYLYQPRLFISLLMLLIIGLHAVPFVQKASR
jgi:hypothetical protein